MKAPKKIDYPFIQETKFGKVKIYRNQVKGQPMYVVSWVNENGRQRQAYMDEAAAHLRMEELLEDYKAGRLLRREITSEKAMLIADYENLLKPHGATLGDAVRFYVAARGKENANRVMAEVAVKEYVAELRGPLTEEESLHAKTARSLLTLFGRAFGKTLDRITISELDTYFKGISEKGRTRNNHRNYVKGFFKWAQKYKKYLPPGDLEIDGLKPYPEETIKVRDMIFTPDQMRRLLEAADHDLMPALAIGAFAGVRVSEIGKMEWEEIDFEQKCIEIPAHKSKVGIRRLPLMPDNLISWLKSYRGEKKGRLIPFPKGIHKKNRRAARDASTPQSPIVWKTNALRKSYISHRMAQPDADKYQVAKQCGNSAEVIERDYKQIVKPLIAEEWFALHPSDNV